MLIRHDIKSGGLRDHKKKKSFFWQPKIEKKSFAMKNYEKKHNIFASVYSTQQQASCDEEKDPQSRGRAHDNFSIEDKEVINLTVERGG
jgi:hypothetical protein